MRKILKALSLVMVLVMCFTMVFTTAVSAEGTDTLVLSVDNAAPKAGETVNITVTSNFTTVAGAHFAIDLAGLEYVSVAGDYAEYFSAETMNFVKEFNEDNGNLVESGVLFVITATVPADAEAGTVYNVGFGTINASKEFCDYDLNEVVVTKTGVDVTVAADEPEVPKCEHVWEVSAATPAEGTSENVETAKGSVTEVCALCGDEVTSEVSYEYDYYFGYVTAEYASQLNLLFSIRKGTAVLELKGVPEEVFMYTSHLISSTGEYTYGIYDIEDARDTTQNGKACKSFTYGLKSMQLTEKVSGIPFIKVNGVWYSGDTTAYSMRDYADQMLPKVDASEKKLIVNMLTYGSKMQQFKDYNLENLADADLGEYAALVTTATPAINNTLIENPLDKEVYIGKWTLDMADRISVLFQFNADGYSGANKTDLVVKGQWVDANGISMNAEYTTADFGTVAGKQYRYTFYFAELNSYDLRQDITFNIYDGDTDVSGSFVGSVEDLLAWGIQNNVYGAEEVAVYHAMLNYCDASYDHFINK